MEGEEEVDVEEEEEEEEDEVNVLVFCCFCVFVSFNWNFFCFLLNIFCCFGLMFLREGVCFDERVSEVVKVLVVGGWMIVLVVV